MTGRGGIARASLAAAGEMIQAQFMYDFADRAPFDEAAGREVRGADPYYHCYRALDGWMFFAAPTERADALRKTAELSDLSEESEERLADLLAERFRLRRVSQWMATFAKTSVGVTALGSLHETRDASLQLESAGDIDLKNATFRSIRHDRHPMGRWVDLVAPNAVRPAKANIYIPGPAPKYGRDTRVILLRLGYSEAAIDAMIEAGTVSEQWSEKYLPEWP